MNMPPFGVGSTLVLGKKMLLTPSGYQGIRETRVSNTRRPLLLSTIALGEWQWDACKQSYKRLSAQIRQLFIMMITAFENECKKVMI